LDSTILTQYPGQYAIEISVNGGPRTEFLGGFEMFNNEIRIYPSELAIGTYEV
jgi:hypothetical protein